MKKNKFKKSLFLFFTETAIISILFLNLTASVIASDDPLPSWNDGQNKHAIVEFVSAVSDPDNKNFVPSNERIAVFDNDGTLWAEQPLYFQLLFAIDRIKELAPDHPEWKHTQPFKAVLENDLESALSGGTHSILELVMASHAGNTTEEFADIVRAWLASARHPTSNRLFTEMVYQPMLELIDYLHANEFKVFIVSGGGIEFIRVFSEQVYDVPPERVVGSSIKTKFDPRNGAPVLVRLPEMNFLDDKEGKPVAINQHIGRIPIAAFGNSDGDLQMLQWSDTSKHPSLQVFIRHTDGEREWAYDRESHIGRLDKGLDEANKKSWTIVDMKNDWNRIFPKLN